MGLIFIGVTYLYFLYIFLIILLSYSNNSRNINETYQNADKKLTYYFFVPCVNEEKVIYKTIKSLLDLDYNCKVIAIDDGSQDRTYEIMKRFESERCLVLKRTLPNARKGKGMALNAALKLCIDDVNSNNLNKDNVIVGVIDADGRLSSNSIHELNKIFLKQNTSAAQLRVKMYPNLHNSLQLVQDFEFFTINNLIQTARIKTNSVGLSGNGQFFRLAPILREIGENPWGSSLLDDYELTLKILLKGMKVNYISDAYVYQEALMSLVRFVKQRSRWVQGNLECLKYLKKVSFSKQLVWTQRMSIYYFFIQPFLSLFADVYIIIFFIHSFYQTTLAWELVKTNIGAYFLSLLIFFILSIMLSVIFTFFYYKDLSKYNEEKPKISKMLILPIASSYMYLVLFISILIAIWRYLNNQNSWIKTKRN